MVSLEELSADEIVTGIFAFSKYSQMGERVLNRTILTLHNEMGILKEHIASPGTGEDCPYFEEVEECLSYSVIWRLLYHYDIGSGWIYEVPSKETVEQKLRNDILKLENEDIEQLKKAVKRFDEIASEVAEKNKKKWGYYLR